MRLDYISYTVAIILFIVTLAVAATYALEQQLWIVTTAVIGLVFVGLGYTQRPKMKATPTTTNITTNANVNVLATVPPPAPSPPVQPVVTEAVNVEAVKAEEVEPIIQPLPPAGELTGIKGIKEKRAAQLKAIGINSVEDLAKASDTDLATKLNISPKITGKWIEDAKKVGQKI
jgi:predicted flap endonuclease-1-like 5' DNA nuclease